MCCYICVKIRDLVKSYKKINKLTKKVTKVDNNKKVLYNICSDFNIKLESVKLVNPVYGLCLINTGRNTVLFPVSVFTQLVKKKYNKYLHFL